jgi:hypothetical protein
VTKFHSTTKILVQYSPWVSTIAVDVISYSSLSLGVGRFIFWEVGGRGYMDLAQIHISIVLLLHYSATCFKSYLCCTGESRSAREAGISVIFRELLLAGTLNGNVTVDKHMVAYDTYFTRDSFLEVHHRSFESTARRMRSVIEAQGF